MVAREIQRVTGAELMIGDIITDREIAEILRPGCVRFGGQSGEVHFATGALYAVQRLAHDPNGSDGPDQATADYLDETARVSVDESEDIEGDFGPVPFPDEPEGDDESTPEDGSVECAECGEFLILTKKGKFPAHGPRKNRCSGSGKTPGVDITLKS